MEQKTEDFNISIRITIGHCVELNQPETAQHAATGIIAGACSSENWVLLDLGNGFSWKGTIRDFVNNWTISEIPF